MAIYNLTSNVSNVCVAGPTSSAPLNLGSLTVYGVCPNPVKVSGLSASSGQVGVAFNATFNISSCTGGSVLGLPTGVNYTGMNSTTGIGTITGTPTQTGSFPLTFAAVNACGNGDTTSNTPSIPLGTLSISAAGSSIISSGSGTFRSSVSVISQIGVAGMQFRSDGTTAEYGTGGGLSTLAPNWFGTVTPGVGSNYWVRATPTVILAGVGFFSGNPHNSWIPISTSPIFWIQNSSSSISTTLVYDYMFEFASDANGLNVVSFHTGCTMSVTNEATNG